MVWAMSEFPTIAIVAIHDNSVGSFEELDEKLRAIKKSHWGGREIPFLNAIDGGAKAPAKVPIEGSTHTTRGATHAAFGVQGWPTTLLIDREGRLLDKVSVQELESRLNGLLRG